MLNLYKTYYTIHKISAKMNNESFLNDSFPFFFLFFFPFTQKKKIKIKKRKKKRIKKNKKG